MVFWLGSLWFILTLLASAKGKEALLDFPLIVASILLLSGNLVYSLGYEQWKFDILLSWVPIILWWLMKRKEFPVVYKMMDVLLGVLIGVICVVLGSLLFGPDNLVGAINPGNSFFALMNMTIQKSIAEEFACRLMMINYLRKFSLPDWAVNIVQAVLFGMAHYDVNKWMPQLLIYVTLGGLIMGYLLMKRKSLLISASMHLTINSLFLVGRWFKFI